MATPSRCPGFQDLQQYLLGHVSGAAAEQLEAHLDQCPQCVETLHSFKVEDTLVEAMRSRVKPLEETDSHVLEILAHRLRKLRSAAGNLETTTLSSDTPPSLESSSEESQPGSSCRGDTGEDYDYLAPPQGPGELGRLGEYRVLKVLGAGGMGVVFQAEDPKLKRLVALKVMKPALAASGTAGKRFLREAQATAAIKHDNIVTIHQVGQDRGMPFLAMEFLEGESLDERLKREPRLPVAEVVRIGREIAEALSAAHERGLMHRDIKPANIWLEGKRGRVKILDFGLARAAGEESQLTQQGAIVGTPAFMSPEQAQGQAVDHRCDLFSLGCVLYRLSTGELPFKGKDTVSTLLALATAKPILPRELNPDVPESLSNLIIHLLAKRAEDRPSSAQKVVESLAAKQLVQPADSTQSIAWVPPSSKRKPIRRPIRAVGIVMVASLIGLALWFAFFAGRSRREAEFSGAKPADGTNKQWSLDSLRREDIDPHELKIAGGGNPDGALPELVAIIGDSRLTHAGPVWSVAYSPDGKFLASGSGHPESTIRIWEVGTWHEVCSLESHEANVNALAYSPDGMKLAAGRDSKRVQVWDLKKRKLLFAKELSAPVSGLAWSPDGKTLVAGSHASDFKLWDAATGEPLDVLKGPTKAHIHGLAFSKDGKYLASPWDDNSIRIWNTATWTESQTIKGHKAFVSRVIFAPDGKRLASASADGTVKVRGLSGEGEVFSFTFENDLKAGPIAFHPDGTRLFAAASFSSTDSSLARIVSWELNSGKKLFDRLYRNGPIHQLAIHPDGHQFATPAGSFLGTVKIWDATTGKAVTTPKLDVATTFAWTPSGKQLAFGSTEGKMRIWDLSQQKAIFVAEDVGRVHAIAFSPVENIVAFSNGTRITLSNYTTGEERHIAVGEAIRGDSRMAFTSDGKHLVVVNERGQWLKVWRVDTGKEVFSRSPPEDQYKWFAGLAVSSDIRRIAVGTGKGVVQIHEWQAANEPIELTGPGNIIETVVWNLDGSLLAASNNLGGIRVWDAATSKELVTYQHDSDVVAGRHLCFSADGLSLFSLALDGRLLQTRIPSGKKLGEWLLPDRSGRGLFAPDRRHVGVLGRGCIYILRLDPAPEKSG